MTGPYSNPANASFPAHYTVNLKINAQSRNRLGTSYATNPLQMGLTVPLFPQDRSPATRSSPVSMLDPRPSRLSSSIRRAVKFCGPPPASRDPADETCAGCSSTSAPISPIPLGGPHFAFTGSAQTAAEPLARSSCRKSTPSRWRSRCCIRTPARRQPGAGREDHHVHGGRVRRKARVHVDERQVRRVPRDDRQAPDQSRHAPRRDQI